MAKAKLCAVRGCGKLIHARGLCAAHYQHQRRSAESSQCSIPDCGKPISARGLCSSHFNRLRRWGDPLIRKRFEKGSRLGWLKAHKGHQGNDCLILPFPRTKDGYGVMLFLGQHISPARVMCILAHGAAPPKKESAHSCGNGRLGCVNPQHLRWATHQENMNDKQRHGTIIRGERNYNAKFSEIDIRRIRVLADQGVDRKTISVMLDANYHTIKNIILRHTWAWLE